MSCLTYAEMLLKHSSTRPNVPFLHQPKDGNWRTLTFSQVEDQARRIAAGLHAKGYAKGSRIGILSKNCAEWFILDAAIVMAGMVSVPIYTTANEKTIRYVIDHSEMDALFVGKMDDLKAAEAAIPESLLTISFPYPTLTCKETWDSWLSEYEPLTDLAEHAPDDLKSVVYTSGSTGLPKGVMLTFRNL